MCYSSGMLSQTPDLSGEYPLSGDDAAALLPVSLGGDGDLGHTVT